MTYIKLVCYIQIKLYWGIFCVHMWKWRWLKVVGVRLDYMNTFRTLCASNAKHEKYKRVTGTFGFRRLMS